MNRIAIGVEYDGSDYYGWQTQAQQPTVQETLELALSRVANESVRVHGSGRTDTGVHAREQIAHFDTHALRSARSWTLGTNTHLPESIRLLWSQPVSDEFHARFSAQSRSYRYRICNRPIRPALGRAMLAWIALPLDEQVMHRAGQALVGEHDFSSFRAAACQAEHAVRRVDLVAVSRKEHIIEIVVEGNAFLHHMVRNIAGSLIEVGLKRQPETWLASLLALKDRTEAGVTAPARGLCLEQVRYPARFGLDTVHA